MNGPYFAGMDESGREQPTYTLPGVLHFIKHEWAKFERERATWDSERAEFQAKIAFLQGERRGQENLKRDLVRRIKMLEYALKQERAKNYELKYGSKLTFSDMVPPDLKKPAKDIEPVALPGQRDSKNILKSYLKEIGYPDYVLDTRVSRLKALRSLGIHSTPTQEEVMAEQHKPSPPKRVDSYEKLLNIISSPQGNSPISEDPSPRVVAQNEFGTQSPSRTQKQDKPNDKEKLSLDVQEAFSELDQVLNDEDESDSSDEDGSSADDELESAETGFDDQMEDEPAEEFTFSRGPQSSDSSSGVEHDKSSDSGPDVPPRSTRAGKTDKKVSKRPSRRQLEELKKDLSGRGDFGIPVGGGGPMSLIPGDKHVNIGPLDWIDPVDELPTNDMGKKWLPKYTMRSHLDAVTSVAFHPTEPLLVTGSEDKTIKVWSLQQSKRSALVDGEPIHTLRGHTGSILSLVTAKEGDICFSAGTDCGIRYWELPVDSEPFDEYDPTVHKGVLVGHTDSVWELVVHPKSATLLSCSADGTCRLWNKDSSNPLISTIAADADLGIPTSCDFLHHNLRQMVVSYNTAQAVIYDIETGQVVIKLNSTSTYDNTPKTQINKIRCHPTLPVVVTGHEDKCIRFFDATSGEMKHEMIAHMDSVSGLAPDPNGLYLLSSSELPRSCT
jgi:striatin 1/3/4